LLLVASARVRGSPDYRRAARSKSGWRSPKAMGARFGCRFQHTFTSVQHRSIYKNGCAPRICVKFRRVRPGVGERSDRNTPPPNVGRKGKKGMGETGGIFLVAWGATWIETDRGGEKRLHVPNDRGVFDLGNTQKSLGDCCTPFKQKS